jgi:hypothetical protein
MTQKGAMTMNTIQRTEALKAHAAAAHADYPQYEGYYDSWTLGILNRRIRTKGGVDRVAGSVVLVNFDRDAIDGQPMVTFYDEVTTHNVVVPVWQVGRFAW